MFVLSSPSACSSRNNVADLNTCHEAKPNFFYILVLSFIVYCCCRRCRSYWL